MGMGLARQCTHEEDFLDVQREFTSRFKRFHARSALLHALESVSWAGRGRRTVKTPFPSVGKTWMALPFHPSLGSAGITRALRTFSEDPLWSSLYRSAMGC